MHKLLLHLCSGDNGFDFEMKGIENETNTQFSLHHQLMSKVLKSTRDLFNIYIGTPSKISTSKF